jgi:alkyl hydroperoxide reductase subunit AhpC
MIRNAVSTLVALGAVALLVAFAPTRQLSADPSASSPVIGAPAPAFTANDTHGKSHDLAQHKGKYVVLEWVNHGCPWVRKWYGQGNMQALQKEFGEKGVVWYSIVSSAPGKQGYETNETHNAMAAERGASPAAILVDATGVIGRAYDARTTPHMYVIDPEGKLIYMGAISDNRAPRPEAIEGARIHPAEALKEAMAGKPVTVASTQPYGCAVRY